MLSDQDYRQDSRAKESLFRKTISNNYDPKNNTSETIVSSNKKEKIQEISIQEESKPFEDINLDEMWKKVIAMLELPSTKMLLSQQAKLINLNSDSAEIAISEKWINMIQSRKNLIEDAFYKARGSSTKVLLIQQKDNLSNHKKVENNLQKIEPKNQIKIDREPNKNTIKEEKIESKNNFKVNSCLLYTSPSPRDRTRSRMPSSA